jgi:hypothetical protein
MGSSSSASRMRDVIKVLRAVGIESMSAEFRLQGTFINTLCEIAQRSWTTAVVRRGGGTRFRDLRDIKNSSVARRRAKEPHAGPTFAQGGRNPLALVPQLP